MSPLWSCQNVCDTLSYLLDNIYIRFVTKLYRQIVRIPMGTNCAPLVADLFYTATKAISWVLLIYNHDNDQANVIETSRYLCDILNIDNPYFEGMVNQIYPPGLEWIKASTTDTEAPIFRFASFYCKWIFLLKFMINVMNDFDIVNFPFWMVTFLAVLLIVYKFRNSLGLLESAIMLRTSTREINV